MFRPLPRTSAGAGADGQWEARAAAAHLPADRANMRAIPASQVRALLAIAIGQRRRTELPTASALACPRRLRSLLALTRRARTTRASALPPTIRPTRCDAW